ncbi:MAG TPA: VCBS repeat-containing protein [Flavisolibacter sp.]|nr:VCBS repeat-containing protein [Flavisolibacter sp.]
MMIRKIVVSVFMITAAAFYLIGCNTTSPEEKKIAEGNTLANNYCQGCHRLPGPELLDKKTWANFVLPKMGAFLHFRYLGANNYVENEGTNNGLTLEDWNKIVFYYEHMSPDSLAKAEGKKKITMGLKSFDTFIPGFHTSFPATTYVGSWPEKKEVMFADGVNQNIYALNSKGMPADSFKADVGPVNIKFQKGNMYVLTMGVMYPSDEKKGKLLSINSITKKSFTVIDSLQRPVYADYADLNNDSLQDIVICEFGNLNGQLSWFENRGNNKYLKHTLRALPGAIHTQIADMNGDGKPDIVALMAQGDEGIFIYFNKGNGQFEEKRVLRLPPSYGSNYFELADFNGDGSLDILATNGDNGDYPPILKPYHGIRIYLNDGHNNFSQNVFLPINGTQKAVARDFDGDGDLDIASISFYPDYDHLPEESFVYWENKGRLNFQPSTFSDVTSGRWLTMTAADIDMDGDEDIILGNAKFPIGHIPATLMKKWDERSPSVVILINRSKR